MSKTRARRRALTLSPAQLQTVEEIRVLMHYTCGFNHTAAMQRACATIARKADPAARATYLERAARRERIELAA